MSLYPLKKSDHHHPVPPNLARTPLSIKLAEFILGSYLSIVTSHHQHDNNNSNSPSTLTTTWNQVVTKCNQLLCSSSSSHHHSTEHSLVELAHQLAEQFPNVPQDLKSSEKHRLLSSRRSFSSNSCQQQQRSTSVTSSSSNQCHHHHPLDISPRELLSSRGKAMFPPLQKRTPRTSSCQESFKTEASAKLLRDEEYFSPAKPPPPMIVTHHYGKANNESLRRRRNQAAIHQAEVVALDMALPQNRPVDVNRAVQIQQQQQQQVSSERNKSGGDRDANRNIKRRDIALNPNQLSLSEIEQILKSVDGSANTNPDCKGRTIQRAAAVSSARYGPYFTALVGNSTSSRYSSNNNTSNDDNNTNNNTAPHMSDEMMDRIRDRHRALRTKQDLDRAMELRRQQLENRKAQYQREVEADKERSAEIARELEEEKQKKMKKRMERQALDDELKMVERTRLDRQLQAQKEKQHYALLANEVNEQEKHHAEVALAVQRHRREEAAKTNLLMASEKKRDRVQKRMHDQELERQLLLESMK